MNETPVITATNREKTTMNRLIFTVSAVLAFATVVLAGDVHVRGYYRSDGTYVRPHVRNAPNASRSDNYGRPSASDRAFGVPAQQRDYDGNGTLNQFDSDDDNDGVLDDNE
ncbi:hypothetical protein HY478_03115 [Candidatus Uhrbacteria bacterium]|nr:hypothetical protein [Candidatus Uhrbacteria bacterium]